ncbi:nuclear transcription factor Y subunit beta-like [Triplophysa dalaica]|uniref:nuclear transcription factor Y subunit beta-like n=1 Tax=Triplophysa dalaica TaxID=1582913 RepID=UPI0024DFF5D3|nr:nuclear transcription factor Y subunit beta-like [Triplophysa dalaica]
MESVLPLKMLGVLALVLLVPSMNEGRILSKCDLKAQLEATEFQVVPDNMTVEDLIAKLVCRANTSGFNTHLVKFITRKHDDPASEQDPTQASFQAPALAPPPPQVPLNDSLQNQRQAPTLGQPPVQSENQPQTPPQGQVPVQSQNQPQTPPQGQVPVQSQNQPQGPPRGQRPVQSQNQPQGPPRGQRPVQSQNQPQGPPRGQRPVQFQDQPQAPPQGPPKGPQEKDRKRPAVWHQYGVFQLNDKFACDSEVVPSLNLCQMNCSALVDDDITDDITCLKTLISTMKAGTVGQLSDSTPLPQKLDTLLVKECRDVVASQYFAECR